MSTISAAITAVGAYVPEYKLTNAILETMVDTNDEWITTRTGIKERRILKDKDGRGPYKEAQPGPCRDRSGAFGDSHPGYACSCHGCLCCLKNRCR